MSHVTAGMLVEGPRGRRLCLELLLDAAQRMGERGWAAAHHVGDAARALEPASGSSVLYASVISNGEIVEPTPSPEDERMRALPPAERAAAALAGLELPDSYDAALLRRALGASVDAARYWQEPDGEDLLAAHPELRPQLLRAAEVVARSDAAAWWGEPIARLEQRSTAHDDSWRPSGDPAAEQLARWMRERLADEERFRRERPSDPTASYSGEWWSMPPSSLHRSTRAHAAGPFGLELVEAGFGWGSAEVRELSPAPGPVLELDGPEAWAQLCRRWPVDLRASYCHDWHRVTGEARHWVAPDWSRVAEEYTAVHLGVLGYLRSATRLIELGDGRASVLAGWDPDATYWLRDGARETGDPVAWQRDERSEEWAPER